MTLEVPLARTALIVREGWDGQQPVETTNSMTPFLQGNGFTVRVEESPAVYTDADYLATVDLILQIKTMASIRKEEFVSLQTAVLNGTGMGGWHGRITDSCGLPADPMDAYAASGYPASIVSGRLGGNQAGWGA